MYKSIFISIILFFLFLSSCSDEDNPIDPIPSEFDVEYIFINKGDPNLSAIEIVSLTYYPKVDKSWYRKENFQKPSERDTLISYAPEKGYIGCFTQMGLLLYKKWQSDSTYWRYFLFEMDTIITIENRITTFYWPDDTSKATELPFP